MSIVHFAALLLLSGCAFVSDATVQDIYDADGDGFEHPRWGGDDCNDSDDRAHPDAPERWYDGVDDNCDNQNDFDQDGDGVLAAQGNGQDCNDLDSTVYPGAEELQDGKDNDCDDLVDEAPGTVDVDLDGFTEANGDCDDTDFEVRPGAIDTLGDGVDQNCDGVDGNAMSVPDGGTTDTGPDTGL